MAQEALVPQGLQTNVWGDGLGATDPARGRERLATLLPRIPNLWSYLPGASARLPSEWEAWPGCLGTDGHWTCLTSDC